MATEKSGMWFLELILNILLLSGVAFVTFASRVEQAQGLAVPMFASMSPGANRPAADSPAALAPSSPSAAPAVTQDASRTAGQAVGKAADAVKTQVTQTYQEALGALEIWAAGLDGQISQDELQKIQTAVGQGWSGTATVRQYLKSVNDRINAGQADAVVQEALKTIGQQAAEKKVEAMKAVTTYMKANGITWEQTKTVVGQWIVQALKMSPMDVWNALQ